MTLVCLNADGDIELWEYITPVHMFNQRYDTDEDDPFWLVETSLGLKRENSNGDCEFYGREVLGEL